MISVHEFYALGDDSGALVDQWLPGGAHPIPNGPPDLPGLQTLTGIADLALTDTIDWAAITWASRIAQERGVCLPSGGRYRTSRPLVFECGGLIGEVAAAGSPTYSVRLARKSGLPAFDMIRLEPAASNRHFVFKDFVVQGGLRCIYATDVGGAGRSIEQNSEFQNLILQGADQEGLFFDNLQAIGCNFRRIRVENCDSHGMWFKGRAVLNGSQVESCRSVNNRGHGFLFENTHDQAFVPGLVLSGLIAEYNDRSGVKIVGCQATMVAPYFESNDRNATGGEPDLVLGSSRLAGPSQVNAQVVCIQPSFSNVTHPDQVKIAGTAPGPQMLTVIQPQMSGSFKIDTTNLVLTIEGGRSDQFVITGSNQPALFHAPGIDLAGARKISTAVTSLGVRAGPTFPAGLMQVLAVHSDGRVASYLVKRNANGTVAATLASGSNFLTFSVNTSGFVSAKTSAGTATVSVHGH